MKFTKLKINGAYLIELEKYQDERGTFARSFCKKELAEIGIDFELVQCNLSENFKAATLRGMHYQKEPYPEPKIVTCTSGSIYDVMLDLRKNSPTYLQWDAIKLESSENKFIYIPPMVAHGFQTLCDDSVVYYQLGNYFNSEYYDGVRWNDPAFGIDWPEVENRIISQRDNNYEDWQK